MNSSLAPYAEIPHKIALDRSAPDRQAYRLIGRFWQQVNTQDNPPMLRLWKSFLLEEEQGWLPLGEVGIDRWFVRVTNASIWFASTNVGRTITEQALHELPVGAAEAEVVDWFAEKESGAVNWAVHECVPACSEPYHHIIYGYGTYCQTELAPPRESIRAFYLTLAWLCSEEGRRFLVRYQSAFQRLCQYRQIGARNDRRRHEVRLSRLTALH